jgi:hypothetical protein
MKSDYLGTYEKLSTEIQTLLAGSGTCIQKMEACFRTALASWEGLKDSIAQEQFDSDAEEIRFFKSIKPKFTGLVEYFTQRYQSLLFLPTDGPASMLYFWKMELRRIQRFFDLHADFVEYCEQENTELDDLYFLRAYNDMSNFEKARVYDLDEAASSSHDWLISKIIAMRKYRVDVEAEIEKLQ